MKAKFLCCCITLVLLLCGCSGKPAVQNTQPSETVETFDAEQCLKDAVKHMMDAPSFTMEAEAKTTFKGLPFPIHLNISSEKDEHRTNDFLLTYSFLFADLTLHVREEKDTLIVETPDNDFTLEPLNPDTISLLFSEETINSLLQESFLTAEQGEQNTTIILCFKKNASIFQNLLSNINVNDVQLSIEKITFDLDRKMNIHSISIDGHFTYQKESGSILLPIDVKINQ